MIVTIKGVWRCAVTQHNNYVKDAIKAELAKIVRPAQRHEYDVIQFVQNNLAPILDPGETDYASVITDFDTVFPETRPDRVRAMQLLKAVFNYKKFRDEKIGWGAYQLCLRSSSRTCPYCHLVHTTTSMPKNGKGGFRPQLDHFYARATYPFLGLSLGNLVPCCAECNGPMMKLDVNCFSVPHLHPQADDESLQFRLEAKKPHERDLPDFQAFRMPMESYCISVGITGNTAKAQASLETFQLAERYEPQLWRAYQVARIARRSRGWVKSVFAAVGLLPTPTENLGFDPGGEEYRRVTTGKMCRDVYLQAGK